MLLHGVTGACIAGVPLALVLAVLWFSSHRLCQQASQYRELEERGLYLYVWTLREDLDAGEKVKKTSLEKKKAWILESEAADSMNDPGQITGKKAGRALKKGTVMKTGLFLDKKKTGVSRKTN